MLVLFRRIILLCALGSVVISAGLRPVQAAPGMTMMAMDGHCCPGDCPSTPDCAPVYLAMMQFAAEFFGMSGAASVTERPTSFTAPRFVLADAAIPPDVAPEGLKKPPKL